MRIIGHRGASHVAPENTIAAVRTALDSNVGFEVDLQLLRDGTLIVLHDDTLERTAPPDAAPTYRALVKAPVTTLRWVDVADVEVGGWFAAEWKGARLPLFRDVLLELQCAAARPGNVGAHCFAELKGERPHDPRLPGAAAAAVIEMRVPPERLTWISFSLPLLIEMKVASPQHKCYYIADARTPEAAWRAARASVGARLDGVDLRADPAVVTKELCDWMHARGKRVAVWVGRAHTAAGFLDDSEQVWSALEANGVDDFTSNLPPALHDWRSETHRASDQRLAASTALGVSAGFGAALALTRQPRLAEDLVDLAHSAVAMVCSVDAIVAAEQAPIKRPWQIIDTGAPCVAKTVAQSRALVPVLPPEVDARARTFVLCSTTYFACDVCLVLSSLACGRKPHQWAGRLAHHAIQFVANLPALARDPSAAVVRKYLLAAYLAEASTILLRLRGLSRATGVGGTKARALMLRGLLVTFAITRLVNFPLNTLAIYRAKLGLPSIVWKLHLAFAAAGIALSSAWFAQIVQKGERA